MKLWIDGQCLQTASRHRGIGRYVGDLLQAIVNNGFASDVLISFNAAMPDEAIVARDHVSAFIPARNIHIWQGIAEAGEAETGYTDRRRLSELALAHHVTCLEPDVALSASPFEGSGDLAVPLPPGLTPGIACTSIFYDAIPHRFPKQYLPTPLRQSYYYRRLDFYKKFDLNFCISEYSRSECIELAGNARSVNISAGVSPNFSQFLADRKLRLPQTIGSAKYILNVGSLDWRKNVEGLIDAFALLPPDLQDTYKLVLAGDYLQPRVDELRTRWRQHGLPIESFIAVGHVSDRELVSLYRGAAAVVQPSLLEGFGLTALEAMSCGTPVIASSTGALPEILQDPSLVFDPMNSAEMADRIVRILTDHDWTERSKREAKDRARRFSWINSAEIIAKNMPDPSPRDVNRLPRKGIASARERTLKRLSRTSVPSETIAQVLARAEPDIPGDTQLHVEATSVTRLDLGTGIQRVMRETIRNLPVRNGPPPNIVYCDGCEGFFKVDVESGSLHKTATRVHPKANDTILMLDSSWEFHREVLPVLFSARMKGAKIISCLYDLVPIRQSAFCHPGITPVFVNWFKSALSYSTGFVCISRTVADELEQMLQALHFPRSMDIGFWHLGADFLSRPVMEASVQTADQRRTLSLLMVGTLEPRKGHRIAIDAIELLWKQGFDVELNIIGKRGWEAEAFMNRLQNRGSRLSWRSEVDDRALDEAYRKCDALIAASFGEGFGLPLIEAMRFGKPIIASDIPVFREITQGNALADFFDVGCPVSLAKAIRKLLSEPRRSATLFQPQSWAQSAAELIKVAVEGNWYRSYQPAEAKPFASVHDYGRFRMSASLPADQRHSRLELVQRPIPRSEALDFVLRITNLSDQVWASESIEGKRCGIFLVARLLRADGVEVPTSAPSSQIPFVLIPGDSHYMRIEIPRALAADAAFVEFEMMQEDVGRWGNALRASI